MGAFPDRLFCAALLASAGQLAVAQETLSAADGCAEDWIPTFGGAPGTNNTVKAMAVWDDGSGAGPALYAGGYFTSAGGHAASYIARWDGEGWEALGDGMDSPVLALTVFDDGSGAGPALYAGGGFSSAGGQSASRIARWDGQAWSALSTGVDGAVVALGVFDDGSGAGPALYAGGYFALAGGQPASRIARWDGQSWSGLSTGMDDAVFALSVFDDGSGAGPALYAGGDFSVAGDQAASKIARWDGQSWSALSTGTNGAVSALTVFDDGSGAGPALYAGGSFTTAGAQGAQRIARWDGQTWSALGSGMNGPVFALTVFDDGSGAGAALYAAGSFVLAGGGLASRIAKWDGQGWSALGSGISSLSSSVRALAVFDDALYAGGQFLSAGGLSALWIAAWDGESWSALGSGMNGEVRALTVFDDGSGAALYAGGSFVSGDLDKSYIAKWDGGSWSELESEEGGGISGAVHALAVFDDGLGAGPALYAGGDIAGGIAKWDGRSWSSLSTGLNDDARALAVFDDGSGAGPALYAGGIFTIAGGKLAMSIAKWDGRTWSALPTGMDAPVFALTVFDDGSGAGPALYAAGYFTLAGGQPASKIARWDGQSWSVLGSGMNDPVAALAVFDDGSGAGSALYAGGLFTSAGGVSANRIAKWDGQGWYGLAEGLNDTVGSLAAFDDGSGGGPALYAGGWFTAAGGQSANRIAKWDGQGWSALSSGMDSAVRALTVFDDGSGSGPALYAGGEFAASPAGDSCVAKWGCPPIDALPGCFGNPAALTSLSSAASIGGTFELSLSSGQLAPGLGLLYVGFDGTDAAGCGSIVSGLGEVLLALAPQPKRVAAGELSAGAVALALPVPDEPALVGFQVAFQGLVLGPSGAGVTLELSNALLVTITQ